MDSFHTEPCSDFKDFLLKVEEQKNKWWIYRGQQIDSWPLKHTFERACQRFGVKGNDRFKVESNMIREFKRRIHHYISNIPLDDSTDEWMALMQHHGAPTRLLDFTYSPYVASYFAFESATPNTKVAIWAVNAHWCKTHLEDISEILPEKYERYRDNRKGKDFNDIFRQSTPPKLLLAINPFRLNERLAYQRGVFLCPGDVTTEFMDNLSFYTGYDQLDTKVIKYTIPTGRNNRNTIDALDELDLMNISRITLFPGLDGFAQSFEPRTVSLFLKQSEH